MQRTRARPSLILPIALLAGLAACTIEVEPGEDQNLEPSVRRMLDRSAEAWNRGDLDGFLAAYQDASSTTFVGSQGLLLGLDEIRAHYAPAFAAGADRDSLRFDAVRVRSISSLIGIVTARRILHRDGVTRASGPFTLVVRRTATGWKIIHDHSSSDPPAATTE